MTDHPFTIIDGVPRDILAKAIQQAAQAGLVRTKADLLNAEGSLRHALAFPGGNDFGTLPTPAQVDAAIVAFQAARDVYVREYAIGMNAYQRGVDLDADETEPAP
jgi:hypothetical protein